MELTPDKVALVHRVVADAGPDPALVYHTDADYGAAVEADSGLSSEGRRHLDFRLWFFDLEAGGRLGGGGLVHQTTAQSLRVETGTLVFVWTGGISPAQLLEPHELGRTQ